METLLINKGIFIDNILEASEEQPKSLICDKKMEEFPISESRAGGNISWSPSLPNWNPWRAANIDEKPLAFVNPCFRINFNF